MTTHDDDLRLAREAKQWASSYEALYQHQSEAGTSAIGDRCANGLRTLAARIEALVAKVRELEATVHGFESAPLHLAVDIVRKRAEAAEARVRDFEPLRKAALKVNLACIEQKPGQLTEAICRLIDALQLIEDTKP